MLRSEISPQDQWDFTPIYTDDTAWEKDIIRIRTMLDQFTRFRGHLSDGSSSLHQAVSAYFDFCQLLDLVYSYANLKKSMDNSNPHYQEMAERSAALSHDASQVTSFFCPEILSLPDKLIEEFLSRNDWSEYHFFIKDICRERNHVLSEAEESLLSMASEPLSAVKNIFTMLNNVDMDLGIIEDETGKEVALTHGNYGVFIHSADRLVRERAYTAMFSAYKKLIHTIAGIYSSSVKADVFRAKASKYRSSLEHALSRGNVPVSVYSELLNAIHQKLPAMKKYLALRKKVLQVSNLKMYDLYTPIVKEPQQVIPFEQAKEIVIKALAPLGSEYQALLQHAFENRWIDVYETPGKNSGAFSWGIYGVHPYVLLNQQDNLDSVFTLAHELGHAMHSHFSSTAQPYATNEYTIMVAEVASTVNEQLLMHYLLEQETNPAKRAALLNQELENYRTTCFRQAMFAEFELKIHQMAEEGIPLTSDSLNQVYLDLNKLYYDGVEIDDLIAVEWARIPHFYTPYYVYQYATGICSATAIAQQILHGNGVKDYLDFLKLGGSDYPINELKLAGVDLTDRNTITSALNVFERDVEELAKLIGA